MSDVDFSDDLLRGADQIAQWLYGSRKFRRNIYHLASTTRLPTFKLGSMICARKSVLTKWIAQQEERRAGTG